MDEILKKENEEAQARLDAEKAEALKHAPGVGLDFDKKKPEGEEPPADPAKDKKPEGEEPPKPAEDKKVDPAPPAEDPAKDKKPEDGKPADPPADPNKDTEAKPDKKYIPIDQYKDEKSKWKSEKEALEADKKALEDQLASINKKEEGSQAREKMIEDFAAKHGTSREEVEDLLKIVESGRGLSDDDQAKINKAHDAAVMAEEREYFDKEWTDSVSSLKKQYPHASEEALGKVKDLIWDVSHKEGFADKDLDYVIFKHGEEIAKLIPPEKPGTRGMETANPGQGKNQVLTAKDFVGKTDFSALTGLPEDQVKSIVASMDPETRLSYQRFVGEQQDGGLEVNRGGRIIRLK